MRASYLPTLLVGFVLLYVGTFGLGGLGLSFHLHGLSLSNSYGNWKFVDAEFYGGSYTDYKVTISTCKIVAYPSGTGYADAAGWFGAYIGGKFVQAGWFSDHSTVSDIQDSSPWAFWSSEDANFSVMVIKQIAYGDTHTYELKQQTDGSWAILCDGTIATTLKYPGTCNEVQAVLETFCTNTDPGQLNVGQTVFSNMYVTSGGIQWSFLQPTTTSVGDFGVVCDAGNNGIEFNSPTQLTEGWGLSTAQVTRLPTSFVTTGPNNSIWTLNVNSAYGNPSPSGTQSYTDGTSVTCRVSSPVVQGSTTYTCSGWTGTGSVPSSGTGTSTTFAITQDSTITWHWTSSSSSSSSSSTGNQTNTPSFDFNIDWNAIWKDMNTLIDANRNLFLALGGLISLVSFIGLIMPPKRIGISW